MADELLVFDAAGSMPDGTDPGAPTNSPISIGASTNYPVTEASFPAPPLNVMYASSVDTEGELPVSRRYGNRTITIRVEMAESGANDTFLDALQVKFAKFQREGGTLKRTRKDGTSVRIYDIVAADGWDPVYDFKYILGNVSEVVMTLPAKPFARGAEVDLGDNVETALPVLTFTEASVAGDVPGLGRIVVDEDSANDQRWLTWGIESRNYSSSANAALFYEAEGRTALGGSAIAAGPSGASGAGSNVMRNTALASSYQAVLSTQATAGGAHLSHIGTFRVWARVQVPTTNTGVVSVAFEWGEGDFRRYTQNDTTMLEATWEGTWRLVDLGLVTLEKVTSGTQRWEGRVLAKSTVAGDDIDVDYLFLVPVAEGSGEVSSVFRVTTPTAFSARDEFDQTAGALTGKTAVTGGVWVGAGDADDFQVDGAGSATRSAASDADINTGRFVTTTTPAMTGTIVTVDAFATAPTAGGMTFGVIARYTDVNNWAMFRVSSGTATATLVKRVAGTITTFATKEISGDIVDYVLAMTPLVFTFYVGTDGSCSGWVTTSSAQLGTPFITASDTALATGGALASGKPGFYDAWTSASSNTRVFDNFAAWVPAQDAAVFASQSLEVRSDRARREDSGGTLWVKPTSYEGSYLLVPPSGAEGRTARMIVKASRSVPGEGPDTGVDDISARLFVTPRYL